MLGTPPVTRLAGANRAPTSPGVWLRARSAVVSEVLPRERLLARAWELAGQIAAQPRLTIRYTRVLVTQALKRMMQDNLGYGLALEGLAFGDRFPDYGPSVDVLARGGR